MPTHLRERRRRLGARSAALVVLVASIVSAAPATVAASDTGRRAYIVTTGDTLSAIARSYGVTVEELAWLNGIEDPDLIFPGESIALGVDPTPVASGDVSAGDAASSSGNSTVDGTAAAGVDITTTATAAAAAASPPWVEQDTVRAYIVEAAKLWGWDPYLIMALAWQESGWRQDRVSWAGAIGVMQLMPDTAASLNDWLFTRNIDPFNNVWDNIEAGVAYLTVLYNETGNVAETIAAYYQGLGSLREDGWFPDTDAYVDNILFMRDMFAVGTLPS